MSGAADARFAALACAAPPPRAEGLATGPISPNGWTHENAPASAGWVVEQERPEWIYPMKGRLVRRNRIVLPWQSEANS